MSQETTSKTCCLCWSTPDIAMWSTETASICAACLANGLFRILAQLSWEDLGPSWVLQRLSASQTFFEIYDLSVAWKKLSKPGEEGGHEAGISCAVCQKIFFKPRGLFSFML